MESKLFWRGILSGAVVLASLASPAVAQAYCRTTTLSLPASYNPSRGCFTQGLFLWWGNACVSYNINKAASQHISLEDATRVIDESFATWVSSTCASGEAPGIAVTNLGPVSCGEVRYNPDTPNQNLIVFRDDTWPYQDPNSTLGLTTVTFNAENGEIYDADMELNASGRNLSVSDQVPANGFDLRSVVTHEAGHFFGLAHAVDPKATMYASYRPGTTALRTLTADDVAGLCAIYPNAQTRNVTPTKTQAASVPATACDPSPRHGLTSQCKVDKKVEESCAASPERADASSSSNLAGALVGLAAVLARRTTRRRPRAPNL